MTDRKKILLALHEDGIGALTFGFYIVRGFLKDNEGIELTVRRQGRMHVFQEWVNKYHQDEGWKGPKPHLELVDNLITIPKDKGEVDCRETIKKLRSYPRQSLDYRARPLSSDWDLIIDFGVPTIAALAASAKTRNVTICDLAWGLTLSRITEECGAVTTERGNSGFVVGERGFGPATALDTVDAPILKPSAFGRGWDLGACVNGGVEGRAGDAPLPPKWLITMGLRQKNRFNECKACGCEPASNHMSGFGFSATDSDSGRRAHGSHERARSARKGRKKHVSVLPRPNRSPWIVVEQNHNGIGKLMVPAFQIYANMNVINDL